MLMKRLLASMLVLLCLPVLAGAANLAVNTATPYGMPDEDGQAAIYLRLFSWDLQPAAYELRHRLRDEQGQSIKEMDPVRFQFSGEWSHRVDVHQERFGSVWYEATIVNPETGQIVEQAQRRLTRMMPVPERTLEQRLNSFMGVNTHQWANWPLLSRMGIHWARDYVWGWYSRGQHGTLTPQGEDFVRRLQEAQRHDMITLPCIQKTFKTPDLRRWMEDGDEITAIFKRIGNHFPDQPWFQIGNEEESTFPGHVHEVENYANFIIHASRGLREAGHGQQIVLAGDQFMYPEMMRELLQTEAANNFIASCIHIYTGTVAPELATRDVNVGAETRRTDSLVIDRMRDYVDLFKEHDKEVWITETGWDVTYGPAVGERLQAVWLPRFYLISLWLGIDKIFWFYDLDTQGTVRFCSSGLIDLDGHVRASGAAKAALSAFAVGTTSGGSVDLGMEDVWCLLWQYPDGRWLATLWSVEQTVDAPSVLAGADAAFDMYGNPITPGSPITDEVAYYLFETLPEAWQDQRLVEMDSHSIMNVPMGGSFDVRVTDLMNVATVNAVLPDPHWQVQTVDGDDGQHLLRVTVGAATPPGRWMVDVLAAGQNWQRNWPVTVNVLPAVAVRDQPYEAGKPITLELARPDGLAVAGQIEVAREAGSVRPDRFSLSGDQTRTITFDAAAGTRGIVPLHLSLDNGVRQRVPLRPLQLHLPQVDRQALDGQPWSGALVMDADYFATDRLEPVAEMAWSPQGLYVRVSMAVDAVYDLDPQWFWTAQNFELFLQPSAQAGRQWTPDIRQFFFVPVMRDGQWHLQAGQWNSRVDPQQPNIFDEPRIATAIVHENGELVMQAWIPVELLGTTPQAGETWRAALTMQNGTPTLMTLRAAWPRVKDDGILSGPYAWGLITFDP